MFELFKMLWPGRNAQASGPYDDTERQRVRGALNPGELPVALLRGRVKKAGPAFWALTGQRLLVFESYGRAATTAVPLQAPMQIYLLPGHYGVTVALYQSGRRHALHAADRGLAQAAQTLAISRAALHTGAPLSDLAAGASLTDRAGLRMAAQAAP